LPEERLSTGPPQLIAKNRNNSGRPFSSPVRFSVNAIRPMS
jgi:hypothetical protein